LDGIDCGLESKRLRWLDFMEVVRIGASSFPPCEAVGSVATRDVAVLEGEKLCDAEVIDTRRSSIVSTVVVDRLSAA
jgi:hypothetical protein